MPTKQGTKQGTYEGWKNYETWNCALWINNEYRTTIYLPQFS
jgi:hypothetical protein